MKSKTICWRCVSPFMAISTLLNVRHGVNISPWITCGLLLPPLDEAPPWRIAMTGFAAPRAQTDDEVVVHPLLERRPVMAVQERHRPVVTGVAENRLIAGYRS